MPAGLKELMVQGHLGFGGITPSFAANSILSLFNLSISSCFSRSSLKYLEKILQTTAMTLKLWSPYWVKSFTKFHSVSKWPTMIPRNIWVRKIVYNDIISNKYKVVNTGAAPYIPSTGEKSPRKILSNVKIDWFKLEKAKEEGQNTMKPARALATVKMERMTRMLRISFLP